MNRKTKDKIITLVLDLITWFVIIAVFSAIVTLAIAGLSAFAYIFSGN